MPVRTPLLVLALGLGALTVTAPPAAATPAAATVRCRPGRRGLAAGVRYGGGHGGRPGHGSQVDIRSVDLGRNDGYDRVVFTLSRPVAAVQVSYVPELVQEGSGDTLPVAGGAVLQVILSPTNWSKTPAPKVNATPNYPGLRQVRLATDFEGYAQYGVGQATKAGFRVLRLNGPDRLVVDVAHPASASAPTSSAATPSTSTTASRSATASSTASPTAPASAPAAAPVSSPAAAGTGPVDPGNGSPLPAIALGAATALAALGLATLAVRLTRRRSA